MQVICSWCGKNLGAKKPKGDKSISHGICKKCAAAEEFRLFRDAGKELKKLAQTAPVRQPVLPPNLHGPP